MSSADRRAGDATTAQILIAFALVYVIWGSTYLFIRWTIATLPPFLMAGARFLIAGAIMTTYAKWNGAPAPDRADWRTGIITGLLMLSAGNGTVVWAEQFTPSGRAALVVATTPVWMVLIDWARKGGHKPSWLELSGLAIGLAGVAYLIGPDAFAASGNDPRMFLGEIALLCGAMSWGIGSLVSRYGGGRTSPAMRTALQMWTAGIALSTLSVLHGDWATFDVHAVSTKSWISFAYLVTFGSVVGFTAYVWLLRVVSPAKASTYAYVNPAVAVFLGWLFAGEAITARTLIASAIIIGGVALVTVAKSIPAARPTAREA